LFCRDWKGGLNGWAGDQEEDSDTSWILSSDRNKEVLFLEPEEDLKENSNGLTWKLKQGRERDLFGGMFGLSSKWSTFLGTWPNRSDPPKWKSKATLNF